MTTSRSRKPTIRQIWGKPAGISKRGADSVQERGEICLVMIGSSVLTLVLVVLKLIGEYKYTDKDGIESE
jgi:hypothetical protein